MVEKARVAKELSYAITRENEKIAKKLKKMLNNVKYN